MPARPTILLDAYRALNVSPNDVLLCPKITPLLLEIGTRAVVLTLLRASSEPAPRAFIACYDDPTLSAIHRRALPFEAFCVAAHIDPTDLLAPITRIAHLHGAMLGAVKAARRHPAVVDASLDAALLPEGVTDRMANLKHMGYLPSPKGSSVNVNVNANATAATSATAASAALPSAEDTIRRMVEARQRQAIPAAMEHPALPAASAPTIPQAFMPRERELVPEYVDADTDADIESEEA